jgi:outer membrane protein TolC
MLALLILAGTAAAAPGFEDTVRGARAVSPTAQMSAEDLIMARHRFAQAVARALPAVSISDSYTYRYNNPDRFSSGEDSGCDPEVEPLCQIFTIVDGTLTLPDNSQSNTLSLSGSLPISSVVYTSAIQQRKAQQQTEVQVRSKEEQLIQQVVALFGDLQYTVAALEMYEASLALARETLEAVAGQQAVGESTELELAQAQLDVDDAALTITQIERALPLMLEEVALVSGRDPAAGATVCPLPGALRADDPLSIDEATSLASAALQVEMDRLDRTSARLDLLPSLTLLGGLSWSGSGADLSEVQEAFIFNYWYVGGSLSMTLFDGLGGYHSRREAASGLRQSELDADYERETLSLDDRQSALDLLSLSEDIALAERSVALQAREVEAARALYLQGGQPFERYTQARDLYEQLQLQVLSLRRQQQQQAVARWVAAGQIDALLGRLYDIERGYLAADRCRAL